ncbi:outer membrane protein assembly factor BamA [Aliisedimentitalea scapharcae]|uniref:Outer membrane protein assembly factor BamA n=1 Tax=Aliisedimentitalea scapharcae TaxID=1524259 RepID=A0ABZ2XMY2_9RHOB
MRNQRCYMLYHFIPALFLVCMSVLIALASPAQAQNYRFNSVKVEGNQRIETSTIIAYTGIERGQTISAGELNDAYQRILDSGVFETVELDPRGSTLVISVAEFPTINRVNFEGNRRIKDEALEGLIASAPRRVFNPGQAEDDAAIIAEAYSQQGRLSARVTPRIIRRSDNRVDLIFEIGEGDTIEVERVSFVGNRVYSDRRLRRVLETKQAGILRAFIRSDTLIEDRIEFDKQVMRDFYLSRGYVDFRVNSANAELARERDAFFLVLDVTEGQQFSFGQISTVSEMSEADADEFQEALKIKPGVIYSPALIENSIARMERLAIRKGIDFLRVEPRISRNDRDLTLDVEFALTRGPRIFVERIDIEGNTTTLDRVIRNQFRIAEGDPFNPREIRQSAERIRALGFFETAGVDVREGSSTDQVVVDVDVAEQPTGSLSLGGSYSVANGIGVAVGLTENNFLGRGQRLSFQVSTAQDAEQYVLGFSEPNLLGRQLRFDLDLGLATVDSSFANYDSETLFFQPGLTFQTGENSRLRLKYFWSDDEMLSRGTAVALGPVQTSEIGLGALTSSGLGFTYTYDSRLTGLNPNAGFLFEAGADYAGLGGDNKYVKTSAKAIAQTLVLNEEVTLRATIEGGMFNWRGGGNSRTIDRFLLGPDVFRGFEPGGIGPRDQSVVGATTVDDALGGNLYAIAKLEAEFPLGLPEELGVRGGVFYDIGNLWDLKNVNTAGATVVGANSSFRHVIGFSVLWDTAFGPLRFNFSNALKKETFDKEQSFDLTLQAKF